MSESEMVEARRPSARKRRIAAVAVVIIVLTAILYLVLRPDGDGDILEASGTVEATEADLGFQAAGRVGAVLVREGDAVPEGAPLARLAAEELEARLAGAGAEADAARAGLQELEAGTRAEELAQGRALVRGSAERAEDAERDLTRARRLFEGGAVSRETLDKAETARAVAGAELEQAREQLRALEAGARPEQRTAQSARVASAEATVRQAEATLDNALVRAPFNGVVTVRHREPGESVQTGQPILTIMDPGDRWVRIYIPEDRIGAVSLGQEAAIRSDTYPERTYPGRVVHIAREAEFTPRNVQTREERVKLVYAVRVAISGDPELVLKPGIPADVELQLPAAREPEG